MRFGPIYATPGLYQLAMRAIYRDRHAERFKAVVDEIAEGDIVADLCAGTSFLYRALADRRVEYRAFDINPDFVRTLAAQGISAQCLDVERMEMPGVDVITMSSALYHFHPRCYELLDRMRQAARKKVIVVEPVRNISNSPLWGRLARWVGRVDGRDVPFHFDQQSLERLLEELGGPQQHDLICAGRDMLVVLGARDYGAVPVDRGEASCAKTS